MHSTKRSASTSRTASACAVSPSPRRATGLCSILETSASPATPIIPRPRSSTSCARRAKSCAGPRLPPRVSSDPPAKAELDAESIAVYTRATAVADYKTEAFMDWLERSKLQRGKMESDIAFARGAFMHLKRTLVYEWREDLDFRAS